MLAKKTMILHLGIFKSEGKLEINFLFKYNMSTLSKMYTKTY